MARTIDEIKQVMLAKKAMTPELDGLTSTSAAARWNVMFYIVAACIWTLETLMDIFKVEANEIVAKLKPHSLRWYAEKAKMFMYGYDLVADADYYDVTGLSDTEIAAAKVVSYSAVVEQLRGLRIKVAHDNGTDLEALPDDQLEAFILYMKRVKDAGVKLNITTAAADDLKCRVTIVYNPLVINETGGRIDGNDSAPVFTAINYFLKNLPFNGVFSVQKFVDAIQAVEGVTDLKITALSARYGALPFSSINIKYTPDAGYLRMIETDFVPTYIADGV